MAIIKKIFLITTLLVLILSDSLYAEEAVDAPLKAGIVELEYWGQQDHETGELVGIYPSVFKELSKRMNIDIVMTLAPYPRIMQGMNADKFDVTITLPDDSSLVIGEKIWTIRLGVLSMLYRPITSLQQLADVRVGVIRGAKFEPGFDTDGSIRKVESVEHENLLQMLETGRIDAIASDLTILNGLIKKNGKTKSDYAEQLIVNELSLHVILSPRSSYMKLNEEINQTITEMIKDGTIEEIIHKYIK